jgi:hypothetical protein
MPVHEDMTIITPDGHKQLKSFKKVNMLLNANGVFQEVFATYIDDYHGYFYEFCFKAIPFTLKCTPDHLVYRIKTVNSLEGASAKEGQGALEKPGFEKASLISIYEYLAMPFLAEINDQLPINLPIEREQFWFLIGVILNRVAIDKTPIIEANRITLQFFNEEMRMIRFPDEINKIPTVNGTVLLNPNLSAYISSIIDHPLKLLYLPLKYQISIFDGFFFDPARPPSTSDSRIMFVIWYIYCRMNKKLANIIYTNNKDYQLNVSANQTPCSDSHIWIRIKDIKVSVERTRVYLFKTEQPSVVISNFIIRPQ